MTISTLKELIKPKEIKKSAPVRAGQVYFGEGSKTYFIVLETLNGLTFYPLNTDGKEAPVLNLQDPGTLTVGRNYFVSSVEGETLYRYVGTVDRLELKW